jgi:regulatory LuxR family protein
MEAAAAELVISEGTAKTHVARILQKLDLRDRIQAVIFAYESGLVEIGATERDDAPDTARTAHPGAQPPHNQRG